MASNIFQAIRSALPGRAPPSPPLVDSGVPSQTSLSSDTAGPPCVTGLSKSALLLQLYTQFTALQDQHLRMTNSLHHIGLIVDRLLKDEAIGLPLEAVQSLLSTPWIKNKPSHTTPASITQIYHRAGNKKPTVSTLRKKYPGSKPPSSKASQGRPPSIQISVPNDRSTSSRGSLLERANTTRLDLRSGHDPTVPLPIPVQESSHCIEPSIIQYRRGQNGGLQGRIKRGSPRQHSWQFKGQKRQSTKQVPSRTVTFIPPPTPVSPVAESVSHTYIGRGIISACPEDPFARLLQQRT